MEPNSFKGKFTGSFDTDDTEDIGDTVCFLVRTKVTGANFSTNTDGVSLTNTFKLIEGRQVSEEFANKFMPGIMRAEEVRAKLRAKFDGTQEKQVGDDDWSDWAVTEGEQELIDSATEPVTVAVVREEELAEEDIVMVDEEEEDEIYKPGVESQKLPTGNDSILKRFLEVQ